MDTISGYSLNFGLCETDLVYMNELFRHHTDIEQVWVYDSRAKGTTRHGADVDLALVGPLVQPETVRHIYFVLEEDSPMPFFFDVLHWDTLNNFNLKDEIQRTAQLLYQRPA